MNRDERIECFKSTQRVIQNKYFDDVKNSIQNSSVYMDDLKDFIGPDRVKFCSTKYVVNKLRSFEAAEDLLDVAPNKKVAVLNFASAKNPGGGVVNGASAQEECLCRVSTLYNVITDNKFKKDFYDYHKAKSGTLYSNRLIYSPDIVIVKDDDGYLLSKPYKIDVITCAAPNLNAHSKEEYSGDRGTSQVSDDQLFNIHVARCSNIIKAAADHGVEVLVLGAFGCGVFRNNPTIVAKAMKKALESSHYKFERVIFPIFCKEWETENYDAFKEVFREVER